MIPKTSISCLVALALSLGVFAQTAIALPEPDDNPDCKSVKTPPPRSILMSDGKKFPLGAYPPSEPFKTVGGKQAPNSGVFDVTLASTKAGAITEISGGVILCGTDVRAWNEESMFFKTATIVFPDASLGGKINCARPKDKGKLPSFCADQNIKDKSFVGKGVSDVWCDDFPCDTTQNQYDSREGNTFVDYDTSGPGEPNPRLGDAAADHCKNTKKDGIELVIVACYESRSQIDNYVCASDAITFKPTSGPYQMKIYQPSCKQKGGFFELGPTFIDTIPAFTICAYANPKPSLARPTCGTSAPNPGCSANGVTKKPCWLQKNGRKGPYTFKLKTKLAKIVYSSEDKFTIDPAKSYDVDGPDAQVTGAWQ